MTHPTEPLRHARQRGLEDYTDRDGQIHRYYQFGDLVLCGERVHALHTLAHAEFHTLSDLQKAGQMDPALVPLCPRCIECMDPPPPARPWRRGRPRGPRQ